MIKWRLRVFKIMLKLAKGVFMKKFIIYLISISLYGSSFDALRAYLHLKREFPIQGLSYYIDYNHDGQKEWIYKDLKSKHLFRLFGTKPTPTNIFGLTPIDQIALPSQPQGYFLYTPIPKEDSRLSWLYISAKTHQVYKVSGATKEGFIEYLDSNGDGRADPISINVQITNNTAVFHIPLSITDISCGWYHTCYIKDGLGYCFGDNAYGELGDGSTKGGPLIRKVQLLTNLTQIGASKEYTCAVSQGVPYCWGRNEYGKLGNAMVDKKQYPLSLIPPNLIPFGHQTFAPLPQRVLQEPSKELRNIKEIATGSWHACARDDRNVYCWGQNFYGALGIGKDPKDFINLKAFDIAQDSSLLQSLFWARALPINQLSPFLALSIAAGSSDHTCIITPQHQVRCWGWNSAEGISGINDTKTPYFTKPSSIVVTKDGTPLQNVIKIATGSRHTCALTKEHNLFCWGANANGELGDGSYTSKPYAVRVKKEDGSLLKDIYDLFSDRGSHTCAIDFQGKLYCWGDNSHGELGIGKIPLNSPYAKEVPLPEPALFGSAGGGGVSPFEPYITPHKGEHTCVVTVNDHIYCWGDNQFGQLGIKELQTHYFPAKVHTK